VQGSKGTPARAGMEGSAGTPGKRLRRPAGLVMVAVLTLLIAACSSGGPAANNAQSAQNAAKAKAAAAAADVRITPANGARAADPSAGITVTAVHGTLKNVTVHTSPGSVTGSLSPDGKTWHSQWSLGTAQSYTVTATASEGGSGTVTTASSFRTLTPGSVFRTQIFEGDQQTYGVGMPIMLTFSQPITNRAAVERSLQLTTSHPVVGAWSWDDSEHLAFRPQNYWPANTQVSFTGHLNGVEGASGVYATEDLTQSFTIGPSVIAVASTADHRTQIYYNGRLRYNWPISTGKASTATPNGTYLTIEKENPVRMIGGTPGTAGYYNELVPWSVRFTFSGDYYHDAPWSVGSQGSSNVSHGCVNLSPADAQTYYNLAVPGDPITITGSTKAGKWDDGWTHWFLPWSQFVKGSALHEAVKAGPDGSTFVSAASVPAASGSSPLQAPPPDNWMAG
jgi:lipoprotein-anchoring transpeptidase ErfK/SrfK